jgi:hypothetical protein
LAGVERGVGQRSRAMWSNASRVAAAVRSSAASAAAAAPTRPVLVLAQALVVALAAPTDASGRESSREGLVDLVGEVWLNKKINCEGA